MTDNLTNEQRSFAMSRIRSKGNRSTELALIKAMRNAGISGWRRESTLVGKPDFVFPLLRLVVFVDGCYWHGCPKCRLAAKSNVEYWREKIARNRRRDKENVRLLREKEWAVVRLWEHDLSMRLPECIDRIRMAIFKPASAAQPRR
jgi:DNA mismatch endonuclease (patch repair protein)